MIQFPSDLELTLITPTRVPTAVPTPTYAMSTETPPLVCGPWVDRGVACTMPAAPTPQPTPLPQCPTVEHEDCVWTDKPGANVPITPTVTGYP